MMSTLWSEIEAGKSKHLRPALFGIGRIETVVEHFFVSFQILPTHGLPENFSTIPNPFFLNFISALLILFIFLIENWKRVFVCERYGRILFVVNACYCQFCWMLSCKRTLSILCLTSRTTVTSARIPEEDACYLASNLCVFSRVQKGTPGLTHKWCVLQRVSLDALSHVTVVLGMRLKYRRTFDQNGPWAWSYV